MTLRVVLTDELLTATSRQAKGRRGEDPLHLQPHRDGVHGQRRVEELEEQSTGDPRVPHPARRRSPRRPPRPRSSSSSPRPRCPGSSPGGGRSQCPERTSHTSRRGWRPGPGRHPVGDHPGPARGLPDNTAELRGRARIRPLLRLVARDAVVSEDPANDPIRRWWLAGGAVFVAGVISRFVDPASGSNPGSARALLSVLASFTIDVVIGWAVTISGGTSARARCGDARTASSRRPCCSSSSRSPSPGSPSSSRASSSVWSPESGSVPSSARPRRRARPW